MAKNRPKPKDDDMSPLNVEIPNDLLRRIAIAKAETGDPIKKLVAEWCERGLADLADRMDRPYLKAKPPERKSGK